MDCEASPSPVLPEDNPKFLCGNVATADGDEPDNFAPKLSCSKLMIQESPRLCPQGWRETRNCEARSVRGATAFLMVVFLIVSCEKYEEPENAYGMKERAEYGEASPLADTVAFGLEADALEKTRVVTLAPPSPGTEKNAQPVVVSEISNPEELTGHEALVKRVAGRLPEFTDWDSRRFEAFYFEGKGETPLEEIAIFERHVLGAWSEVDVDTCFASLEENLEKHAAWDAKRNAAAGWAERNWVAAYEWYQVSGGDVGGLARLGGDATGLIEVVFRKMAEADLEEAREAVRYLQDEGSREVALGVLEEGKDQAKY